MSRSKKFKGIGDQSLFVSSLFLDQHSQLFKTLESSNPSQYDQIMDAVYSKTHIGGNTHRHFDGSHTLLGSYNKIKEATSSVDIVEYCKSHFNELITPEGIPLCTLNEQQYKLFSHQVSEKLGGIITPGQIREYLRDFNSLNIGELFSASLGGIFLFLACHSGNRKAISRVTALNLCLAGATANPLQFLLGLGGLVYGLHHGKIKSYELLRGAAPAISGLLSYQTVRKLFGISKNGSIILSIGASIGTEILFHHLETKKKKEVLKELGDHNPSYIVAMTPLILKNEFMKLSLHQTCLSLGTAI